MPEEPTRIFHSEIPPRFLVRHVPYQTHIWPELSFERNDNHVEAWHKGTRVFTAQISRENRREFDGVTHPENFLKYLSVYRFFKAFQQKPSGLLRVVQTVPLDQLKPQDAIERKIIEGLKTIQNRHLHQDMDPHSEDAAVRTAIANLNTQIVELRVHTQFEDMIRTIFKLAAQVPLTLEESYFTVPQTTAGIDRGPYLDHEYEGAVWASDDPNLAELKEVLKAYNHVQKGPKDRGFVIQKNAPLAAFGDSEPETQEPIPF